MNKITLLLLTLKGYRCLQAVINAFGSEIIDQVIIGSDEAVEKDYSEEIIELCELHKIPHKKRNVGYEVNTNYTIAISWKWMIKPQGLIVLHDSILPKYRGFAPVVNALINGDTTIGVTAIFANQEYDKGDIIDCEIVGITYPIKVQQVIEKICECYETLIVKVIKNLNSEEKIWTAPQIEYQASYSPWLDEDDYEIDWTGDAKTICRFIDSVGFPYKGATASIGVIYDAEVIPDVLIVNRKRHIGKVIFIQDGFPVVICGYGLLKIKEMVDFEGNNLIPFKHLRTRF